MSERFCFSQYRERSYLPIFGLTRILSFSPSQRCMVRVTNDNSAWRLNFGDDSYVCCLDKASKKKAKDELFERNAEDRKTAVRIFRQWILQQDWITTPTDFSFLLRFLRVRKFSQLEARQTLENYWKNKAKRPDWHADLDPADPILQEILKAKTYYSPKKYDSDGCRWIFSPFGHQSTKDIKKWGLTNVYRAMVLFLEWVCYDENVQVNGVKWFIDFTDLSSTAVMMKYSRPDDQKCVGQLFQKSAPIRMKAFYLYNEPSFFDILYTTYSALTRQKILDRVHMVGKSMTKVYEHIDKSLLPDEYLPDDYTGPSAGFESDIVDDMLADMMLPDFRNYIREVTSSKYGINLEKRNKQTKEQAATFRKLNID